MSTVDTGFLRAGMLAAAEYFDQDSEAELEIRTLADALHRRADWPWACDGGATVTLSCVHILNSGQFCGEGCLTGQPLRLGSATAMTECELMGIDKKAMLLALHRENRLADMFMAYLLGRNIRYEADLVDQLFSSSEKRLARTLLLLSHFGKEGRPETIVHKISQETLAEMIGTTRSRVNFFMNKFKQLGFIEYNGGLKINPSLLTIIVHD